MTISRIIAIPISLMAIAALTVIVLIAIGSDRLWALIGGVAVFGAVVILAGWMVARNIVVPLLDAKTKRDGMRYDFLQNMASKGVLPNDGSFVPLHAQIAAPKEEVITPIDPRHELLVNLCLSTIRAESYGPASDKLLTADDAQARGGMFSTRDNWDAASKYGQSIGMLYTQVGGPPKEQGLKIGGRKLGGCTVTDLLEALHSRNVICDSAVNALPGRIR